MPSVPRELRAQRVLGVGDDATVLNRGAVRMSVQASWTTYNELYGPGGKLEALGTPLSPDSLGIRQFALLRPIRTSLRELAQLPTADVTLGPARTDFTARILRNALTLDYGFTSRIMLTGRLPYEHSTSEVTFGVNRYSPATAGANIGLNPALVAGGPAAARNQSVIDAVSNAVAELTNRLAACDAAPSDPVCTDRPKVEALLTDARSFAAELARTYGNGADTARGALFVPLAGTTLQGAVEQRVTTLNTTFKTYIPELNPWALPFAAQAPVTGSQVQELLRDSLGLAQIGTIERSHIGDVEVGAKVLLIDTFRGQPGARAARRAGVRLAVGGLVRFGTGQSDTPDDVADIGTGDGQNDVEVSGAADVVLNRRVWTSLVARMGIQLADDEFLRIPDLPREPFVAASRQQRVGRDLGDYLELEATPRFVYNDYLSLSAQWRYRRKSADEYRGTFGIDGPDGTPVTIDASVLGTGTEQTEQRVAAGVTFSTLRAFDRRRARLPMELRFVHGQTVAGSGYVPKQFSSEIELRLYFGLLGAPRR